MTYKVTVTEDVTSVSASGNTTSINLTGEQTEISVVNLASSVTYNPTAPFTATNVQDALPQAYQMIGEQSNNFDVHIDHGNSFKILSNNEYAEFTSYGGIGGWATEIVSSGQITLRNGNDVALNLDDGAVQFYDTLYSEYAGGWNDNFIELVGGSGTRKHISLRSGSNERGYIGVNSSSMFIGSQETAISFINFGGEKQIVPCSSFNIPVTGTVDIGRDNSKFKSLYLSDNLYAEGAEFEDGNITFTTSNFSVKNQYSTDIIRAGSTTASLYYSGALRLNTNFQGVYITGTLTSSSTIIAQSGIEVTGNVEVTGNIETTGNNEITGNLEVSGNSELNGDVTVNANTETTGTVNLKNTSSQSLLEVDASSVALKYNGSEKLETTNTGISVTGTTNTDALLVDGGASVFTGASDFYGDITTHTGADITVDGVVNADTLQSSSSDVTIQSTNTSGKVEIKGTAGNGVTHTNFFAQGITAEMKTFGTGKVRCNGSFVTVTGFFNSDTGVIFGGSANGAEHLQDYEEGSWTPTLNSTAITFTNDSTYQRIGNTVTLFLRLSNISDSSSIDMSVIGGYPFAPISSNYRTVGAYTAQQVVGVCWLGTVLSLTVINFEADDGVTASDNDWLYATITYETDA